MPRGRRSSLRLAESQGQARPVLKDTRGFELWIKDHSLCTLTPHKEKLSFEAVDEDVNMQEPYVLLVECEIMQPLWKTVRWFLKKLNIRLPFDPETLLLDMCIRPLKAQI